MNDDIPLDRYPSPWPWPELEEQTKSDSKPPEPEQLTLWPACGKKDS